MLVRDYPCGYRNTETNKTYRLTLNSANGLTKITATCSAADWGAVDWDIAAKTFSLHTLESHPEKGSGLGGLLMHQAALEALNAGCTEMKILNAAQTERDFYLHMGCTVDLSPLKSLKQSDFTPTEWQKMIASCPLVGNPGEVLAAASKSMYKRWEGVAVG